LSLRLTADSTLLAQAQLARADNRRTWIRRDRLTGEFKDSYTSLIHDVVTRIEAEAYFRGGQRTRRGVNVSQR
jgi:hypothetical protein